MSTPQEQNVDWENGSMLRIDIDLKAIKCYSFPPPPPPRFYHVYCFLFGTASPQQLHALVQVLYNILKEYILIPEENKRNVLPYKDALVNLAETNVPYKTKKRILVQEGDGFIQDLLVPAVTSLGFLML